MGNFMDEYIKDALDNKDMEDMKEEMSFRFTVTIPMDDARKLDVLAKYLRTKRATLSSHAITVLIMEFEKKLGLDYENASKYLKGQLESVTEIQKEYFENALMLGRFDTVVKDGKVTTTREDGKVMKTEFEEEE